MRFDHRIATTSLLAIGALALAGCGQGDTIEARNESAQSVAEKVAKADMRPSPGRWEASMKIVKMDIAGMPPEAQAMMKGQIGKINTMTSCLTKEEAERSEKDLFKPSTSGDCTYNNFKMGAGALAADMTCKDPSGSQHMKMTGSYGAEAYAMKVSTEGDMGGQKMSMAMEVEAKRVGECDGSEKG